MGEPSDLGLSGSVCTNLALQNHCGVKSRLPMGSYPVPRCRGGSLGLTPQH